MVAASGYQTILNPFQIHTYKTVGGSNLDTFVVVVQIFHRYSSCQTANSPDPEVLSKPYRLFVKQIQ